MSQEEFQRQVLQRLTAIETNGEYFAEGLKLIRQHGERITAVESSARSAHHRINGIYTTAGVIGGIAGALAQFFASLWSRGGGH